MSPDEELQIRCEADDDKGLRKALIGSLSGFVEADSASLNILISALFDAGAVTVEDRGEPGISFIVAGLGPQKRFALFVHPTRASVAAAASLAKGLAVFAPAAPAIAMLGAIVGKGVALLDNQSGACCNYSTMFAAAAAPLSPEEIAEATSEEKCRFPSHHCEHRDGLECRIHVGSVRTNLAVLRQVGAAKVNDADRWTVSA